MLLIRNGYIKTMAGEDIAAGCVLVGDDGKIAAVGENILAPEGAEVIDAKGMLVTPGCVDGHSHIGIRDSASGREGNDFNEKSDPIAPHMRAIDGIYPQDEAFALAVKGGVTTACIGPGSSNVVGGTFAALKLYGCRVDNMVIKEPIAMKCAFGENPKNAYGQTAYKTPGSRMAVAALLRELLFKSRNYLAAKEAGREPAFDFKLEAMIPVMRREIPLKAHAHRADDICTAIRIAKEFNIRMTLEHCTDGTLVAEELGKEGIPVMVGPVFGSKSKPELKHKNAGTAAALYKAGVPISIISDAPALPAQSLPMYAGMAVKEGLPKEEAWRAITINPAVEMGISDRVGSLEVGKDADLVIWREDPLTSICAETYMTIIDGKIIYSSVNE